MKHEGLRLRFLYRHLVQGAEAAYNGPLRFQLLPNGRK